ALGQTACLVPDLLFTPECALALGSSLVVEPAASLPRLAAENGARLVILNREQTPLDGRASLVVNAPLGELFAAVAKLELTPGTASDGG
ncbi:MAG: hypothetical protein O3C17_26635, partial [Planctomycetota bacterium]|nr:hypothetical protein [Planctomycetota bacterium]